MRMRVPLLLAGLVGLVTLAAEPTASSLKQCPSGHPTLKDVPVVYGPPPPPGPAAEAWQKGIENLEFVPGGSVN